jgi:ABC-type nitrate/sulfonate/bicarbonate transport system permease component
MNSIQDIESTNAGVPIEPANERTREDFARHVRSEDRRIRLRRLLRGGAGVLVILLAWQFMSQWLDLELLLPPPLTVLRNVIAMLSVSDRHWLYGPNIYVHLLHSFLRAMTGFGAAAIVAIPLGLVLGRIVTIREFVMPSIKGVYPIPGIAWIPLAILWFGLGDAAVVFVVFATTFFPMFFSTEAGARQINPTILDAGRCFGARGVTLFFRIVLPATVPYIITGLRISLGGAWRMIVAGEMLASQDGIGYVLMESRFQFKAVDLMTAMILVAIVGYATEKLIVDTIEKRTLEKWEVQPS